MSTDIKEKIKQSLSNFSSTRLYDNSIELLKTLGYESDKILKLKPSNKDTFINNFIQDTTRFNDDKALTNEWKKIEFLFQITKDEFSSQGNTLKTDKVNNTIIESYLFFAIQLKGRNYTRTQLANITREINKQFPMPVMLLFQYKDKLTISIIDRRLHKRDESKDVLEKVTLIKDIHYSKPHRAHIEILFDLSFYELNKNNDIKTFVDLHNKWKETLNISELNKKFYKEISSWFYWMVDTAKFYPDNLPEDKRQNYNIEASLRLITRLIFNWFIKEKGLLPENIFCKETYKQLLKYEYRHQGNLYYKTILQNLFFGCLNQKMGSRKFRKSDSFQGKNQHYKVKTFYRYEKFFDEPEELIKLLKNIPFLNGGLFECLDSDFFTDRENNPVNVSDELFFQEQPVEYDLSKFFKDRSYKKAKVKGIIPILNQYKFTIDESTPIEEEIALDPELLGRIFENLLATYNPETATTARKATGSYYTPREIVNYMVDQSIIAYLETQLTSLIEQNGKEVVREYLESLLAYTEKAHPFTEEETDQIIEAINNIKILDPACGSGAFPMGILHKLVYILSKLDPDNKKWKQAQLKVAGQLQDSDIRNTTIEAIEESFAKTNYPDYSRKLYLIQNCIFGVDIQPIAIQISKLRFFISLIVEEKINKQASNLGIISLPNLETKFVAANTLIELPESQKLKDIFGEIGIELKGLMKKLKTVREKYFTAKTYKTKKNLKEKDAELREKLRIKMESQGMEPQIAKKIADWNPYKPDVSSGFFDPEWMFGVKSGFDIVIGNPPYGVYISRSDLDNKIKPRLKDTENSNSAAIFIDFGKNYLLSSKGILAFIVPKSLLYSQRWFSLVKSMLELGNIEVLIDVEKAFDKVKLEQVVFVYGKTISKKTYIARKFLNNIFINTVQIPNSLPLLLESWICDVNDKELKILQKLKNVETIQLNKISQTKRGVGLQKLLKENGTYPVIGGKNIAQYSCYGNKGYLIESDLQGKNTKLTFMKQPKIISQDLIAHIQNPYPHILITSFYDKEGKLLGLDTVQNTIITNKKFKYEYITALLNSKFISWYTYKFIYCSAIRTMHFDNYYIGKIIIPVNEQAQEILVPLVNQILDITKSERHLENRQSLETVNSFKERIDLIIYKLYTLDYSEVVTVDPNFRISQEYYETYDFLEEETKVK